MYRIPLKYIFIWSLLWFTYRWNIFEISLLFCYNFNSLHYAWKNYKNLKDLTTERNSSLEKREWPTSDYVHIVLQFIIRDSVSKTICQPLQIIQNISFENYLTLSLQNNIHKTNITKKVENAKKKLGQNNFP